MGSKQIRVGQLIAPFGPGSIYTDRRGIPHVVAGLDHWFTRWDTTTDKFIPCSNRGEFELVEPRLSNLLRVDRFCIPPDYRHFHKGREAAPNAGLFVPALRCPRWYRHTKSGLLRRFNAHTPVVERPPEGGRWQPVRFVAVCVNGHLCDFPWKQWINCLCPDNGHLILTDRGGSELSSVTVECRSCPDGSIGRRGKNLRGTTIKPPSGEQSAFQAAGISCPGDRPWLGEGTLVNGCAGALIGALINQTNLYFPRTISALALPDLKIEDDKIAQLRAQLVDNSAVLGIARTLWKIPSRSLAVTLVKKELDLKEIQSTESQIEAALESLFEVNPGAVLSGSDAPSDPEPELITFRRAEFNIIRKQINDPSRVPDLRVIEANVSNDLTPWFSRVNLVERLRETRAFFGFDRLEPASAPLVGLPQSALQQLFRQSSIPTQERWLPAIKVYGEGIYLELREDCLTSWQSANAEWLAERLNDAFNARVGGVAQILPPLTPIDWRWVSRYFVVHTLAHVLINQLVFECGYSTASLRERLYVSADPSSPMAALLIYTAAGDSEGTLGGLVRIGRPERLSPVVHRAIGRAAWCSTDPICSEQLGGQGSRLANLAACQACTLLPETSCETINQGLDRALLVGTPNRRTPGLFASLATFC